MIRYLFALLATALVSAPAAAERLIEDSQGKVAISGKPGRVIALEYSFVDALTSIDVLPIGIADDNQPERMLTTVLDKVPEYQSVGLRSQPNLEVISQLKPDLILADTERHQAIYAELSEIAPTLLLPSRSASYETMLNVAGKIGTALDRSEQMQQRINQHRDRMQQLKTDIRSEQQMLFAIVSSRGMTIHGPTSFASGVMAELGINVAAQQYTDKAYTRIGLEQLLQINPDWLFLGIYGNKELLEQWGENPLWRFMSAEQKTQIREVSPAVWSLSRGMQTAEQIGETLVKLTQ